MLPPTLTRERTTRIQNHRLTKHIDRTTEYYSIKHKTQIQTKSDK